MCSNRDSGSHHAELSTKVQTLRAGSPTVSIPSSKTVHRGVDSMSSARSDLTPNHTTTVPKVLRSVEAAQAATRMATQTTTPAADTASATYSFQRAQMRQMIEDSLKHMGMDGVVAVPQNLTATDVQNMLKQADAILEQRRNEARIAATRQQSELVALYQGQVTAQPNTTASLGYDLPQPTYMPVQYTYRRFGGMDNLGWYDEAAAARRDALQMYDYQMNGSMGWTGYGGDIDE